MLVKNWMSRPVITINPRASMQMAGDLMQKHHVRSLPVIAQDKLIGLLTDRDIKRASASDATSLDAYELAFLLQGVKVEEIMSTRNITIAYDSTLSEAADLFFKDKLEAIPVMVGKKELVGILCPSDVARAFLTMTSYYRRGLEAGLRISDQAGVAMGLVDAVRKAGGRLASLIVTQSKMGIDFREVYLHVYDLKPHQQKQLVEELKQKGTLVYLVDHFNAERSVFSA